VLGGHATAVPKANDGSSRCSARSRWPRTLRSRPKPRR
jgi:hypothetical protein